jgi:hypothetical protein
MILLLVTRLMQYMFATDHYMMHRLVLSLYNMSLLFH